MYFTTDREKGHHLLHQPYVFKNVQTTAASAGSDLLLVPADVAAISVWPVGVVCTHVVVGDCAQRCEKAPCIEGIKQSALSVTQQLGDSAGANIMPPNICACASRLAVL